MSKRTIEANRAITEAWRNEQELVRNGVGTRDWTPQQQQDILEKGRAYDDDGKAFEGHHMKSVERFPEYQGDCKNIQFLSRQEHISAHNGNFQNPTNGFFNPVTGITKDFATNGYEPCEVKKLSNPVLQAAEKIDNAFSYNPDESDKEKVDLDSNTRRNIIFENRNNIHASDNADAVVEASVHKSIQTSRGLKKLVLGIGRRIGSIGKYVIEHKEAIIAISSLIGAAAEAAITIIDGHSSDNSQTGRNDLYSHSSKKLMDDDSEEDDGMGENDIDDNEYTEKEDRASPREHLVSGYDRIQNGKKVHVNSYTRGKNREN